MSEFCLFCLFCLILLVLILPPVLAAHPVLFKGKLSDDAWDDEAVRARLLCLTALTCWEAAKSVRVTCRETC